MRAILATALALMMTTTLVPLGGANAGDTSELTVEELNAELGAVEIATFQVPLAAAGAFQVTINEVTGEITTDVFTGVPRHGGEAAGCIVAGAGFGFGYMSHPVGAPPAQACSFTRHGDAVIESTMVCATAGSSCSMIGLNQERGGPWGFLITTGYRSINCSPGGAAVGGNAAPTCSVFAYGKTPDQWSNWYAYTYKFGDGATAGVWAH